MFIKSGTVIEKVYRCFLYNYYNRRINYFSAVNINLNYIYL